MHRSAPRYFVFAYDRDVVFTLARHHAGTAAHTLAQVDHHAPLVLSIQLWRLDQRCSFAVTFVAVSVPVTRIVGCGLFSSPLAA